jgi:hypothetical protein
LKKTIGSGWKNSKAFLKALRCPPDLGIISEGLKDGVKFPVAVSGRHLEKYFPSMWDDGQ